MCICASVCNELLSSGILFGFASNFPGKKAHRHLFMAPGLSNGHFRAVLEYLATVFMPWGRFSETPAEIASKMPVSTEVLAVMPNPSLEDWVQLKRLQSRGHRISAIVLKISPEHSDFCNSIPVYRPLAPVDWRSGELIRLERLVPEGASVSV